MLGGTWMGSPATATTSENGLGMVNVVQLPRISHAWEQANVVGTIALPVREAK
jgi:hypothetical protein